jgi:hypothetical protein
MKSMKLVVFSIALLYAFIAHLLVCLLIHYRNKTADREDPHCVTGREFGMMDLHWSLEGHLQARNCEVMWR